MVNAIVAEALGRPAHDLAAVLAERMSRSGDLVPHRAT